jgi:hypothetical protein
LTNTHPPETASARSVGEQYQARLHQYTKQAEALGERSRLLSNFRGLSFGTMVIAAIGWMTSANPIWPWLTLLAGAAFGGLIWAHSRVLGREDLALRWRQVNDDALKRVTGDYRELPLDGAEFRNPIHPYADDLDLFGKASIFQLINRAQTKFGQQRMAAFLMNRCPIDELKERQDAVKELTPLLDLRQEIEALALHSAKPLGEEAKDSKSRGPKVVDPEPLMAWAEAEPKLIYKPWLVAIATVLPVLTCLWIGYAFFRGWHAITWIGPLVVHAILLLTAQAYVGAVFAAVSSHQGVFLRFGPLLKLVENANFQSEALSELRKSTQVDGPLPSERMRKFERIVSWFELRHNGLVYPFFDLLFLWDFHCVFALERWQRETGKHLRQWFRALGELEALASVAGFAYDNPEYSWPTVVDGRTCFEATNLGHPLILKGRVTNDVSIPEGGRALLITGSNMSGKSTLMRAIGVNVVLAQAGAPVCASRMSVSPLNLRTSMRMSDSLEQGVSHFYAELRKLKAVLDACDGDVPVMFLLDEVLHGTNSRERQIGARWVLAELLRNGAIGAVSTHDSGLCTLPEPLMSAVQQVHLREVTEGAEMTFDYKLRPGPVQSGNALRLMRSLGIAVPLQGDTLDVG